MHYFVLLFQKLLSALSIPLAILLALGLASTAPLAHAGIKVLGAEIGVSTIDQIRQQASANGPIKNGGTSKWSQGPSLEAPGSNFQVQGLQSVLYIFTPDGKLAGLVMVMGKDRFDEVFDVLAGKYKTIKKERPFVGNNYAKFSAPDSVIELDAPHLGFDMEVRYMTNSFAKAWQDGVQLQRQQKRSNDQSSF